MDALGMNFRRVIFCQRNSQRNKYISLYFFIISFIIYHLFRSPFFNCFTLKSCSPYQEFFTQCFLLYPFSLNFSFFFPIRSFFYFQWCWFVFSVPFVLFTHVWKLINIFFFSSLLFTFLFAMFMTLTINSNYLLSWLRNSTPWSCH